MYMYVKLALSYSCYHYLSEALPYFCFSILGYHDRLNVLKYALDKFEEDPEKFSYLDPNQVDHHGNNLFHLIAKAKYNNMVLSATELLCKHNLSSSVYNNDGKMPSFYIKKQNDRRLQYIKLAGKVQAKPSAPKQKEKKDSTASDQSEFKNKEPEEHPDIREVVKISTQREIRKRKIEDSIRQLPESKISIFNIDHSPTKSPRAEVSEKGDNLLEERQKEVEKVTRRLMTEFGEGQSSVAKERKYKMPETVDKNKPSAVGQEKSLKMPAGSEIRIEKVSDKDSIVEKGQGQRSDDSQRKDVDEGETAVSEAAVVTVDMEDEDTDVDRLELYSQVPVVDQADQNEAEVMVEEVARDDEVIDDAMESEESDTEEIEEEFVIDAQVRSLLC